MHCNVNQTYTMPEEADVKLERLSTECLSRFSIVKALEGTFNKEKALVRALFGHCETSWRFVDSSTEYAIGLQ